VHFRHFPIYRPIGEDPGLPASRELGQSFTYSLTMDNQPVYLLKLCRCIKNSLAAGARATRFDAGPCGQVKCARLRYVILSGSVKLIRTSVRVEVLCALVELVSNRYDTSQYIYENCILYLHE
jgi:hypothetical protein